MRFLITFKPFGSLTTSVQKIKLVSAILYVGLVFRGFDVQVDKRRQASKAKGL